MDKAIEELMRTPLVGVPTFKILFRVSSQIGYRTAQEGRFGAIKIGAQYRFPSATLREALGLSAAPALAPASIKHAATTA